VDADLVRAVNLLLMPAGGSPLIAANTYTLFLRALATSSRASPKITLALLEADIVDTLYQILTGVLPSTSEGGEEQGDASGGQGLGGGLADMTVMENLAHRSKDQVEEALSLISELMPPLPKGLSNNYISFYLRLITFCRWCVRSQRLYRKITGKDGQG
jgi:E3 ubiquitin-protein ligase TRIP12